MELYFSAIPESLSGSESENTVINTFTHHKNISLVTCINFLVLSTSKKKEAPMDRTSIPQFLAGSNVQKWELYMLISSFRFNFYITNLQMYSVIYEDSR